MLISVHHVSSVKELWEILHPDSGLWAGSDIFKVDDRNKWVFRGHYDADWHLIPSAYRQDSWEKLGLSLQNNPEDRLAQESMLLQIFVDHVDKKGLVLPHTLRSLIDLQQIHSRYDCYPWPREELWPVLGLAQHYGIPTRLLDWSWKPLVALYFATSKFFDSPSTVGRSCIWALDTRWMTFHPGTSSAFDHRIVRIPATTSSNDNLYAQAGTFTLDTVNEILRLDQVVEQCRPILPEATYLRQIVFERSLAKDILRILSYEGIHAGSVYSGYNGVVQGVREAFGLKISAS